MLQLLTTAFGRFCCKSLFALVIKISFGCTRDFRVNMWGTSLPEDKLAGDLGNVIGVTSIGGRRSDFFYSQKIGAGQFGAFATKFANCGLVQRSKSPSLDHLVGAQQRWRHVEAERLGVRDVGLTVHIPQARRDYCDGDSTLLIRGVLGTQHMRKIAAMGEHSNRGAACSQWGYCS